MIPDAYRPLFERLYEKTMAGEVNWGRSPRQGNFVVSFSDFSLRIYEGFDRDENESFVSIRLINDRGRDADGFWISEGEPDFDKAVELYQGAKRRADRIDITLARILDELSQPGAVGEPESQEQEEEKEDDLPF